MKAEDDFINLMSEMARRNGLGEVASRIFGILYIEPDEICLEELCTRTGYSMAAVSTDLKMLTDVGMVTRLKKPGSRKLFFAMEKDFTKMIRQGLERKYKLNIPEAKEKIPKIIQEFRQSAPKDASSRKKLEAMELYYKRIMKMDKIFTQMFREMDDL